jgi:TPR repeat protein
VRFTPIRHRLILKRCCDRNSEQRSNFNLSEVVYRIGHESFLEALRVGIAAFKDYHATIAQTQLQAKTSVPIADKRMIVTASIIRDLQRMAEMKDTAGIVRLGKCYWRAIGVQSRQAVALDCFAQIFHFALGVNRDLGKAAQLFNHAAGAAHGRAMCNYRNLLEKGRDVPQWTTELVDMSFMGHQIHRNVADDVPEATYGPAQSHMLDNHYSLEPRNGHIVPSSGH